MKEWYCADEQPCGHVHRYWLAFDSPAFPEGGAWIYPEDVIVEFTPRLPPGKWAVATTVGGTHRQYVTEAV